MAEDRIDFEFIDRLLNECSKLTYKEIEQTIFSIGGRGHYENPISDVLAFYLFQDGNHQLSELMLVALLQSLDLDLDAYLTQPVDREVITEKGNRIDLLLVSDSWVMAIENKIYHTAENPFDDYKTYLNDRFSDKDIYYVLLSPKGDEAEGWISLDYGRFIEKIEAEFGVAIVNQPFNKWVVFLRDFVLNMKLYTEKQMDLDEFRFIENNLADIYALDKVKESFNSELISRGTSKLEEYLPNHNFSAKVYRWYSRVSIRFFSEVWGHHKTVALYPAVNKGQGPMVGVYYDSMPNWSKGRMLDELEGVCSMENFQESKGRWDIYHSKKIYGDVLEALDDMVELAKIVELSSENSN